LAGKNQFGKLKILLPGNVEQTKDLACWIAVNVSDHISFFNGELKVHSGLIMGERIPETSEEEQSLGEDRWFAEGHIVEVRPTPKFDDSSFRKIGGEYTINAAVRHYNAAVKATNPVDQFLGLFRVIEDFYGHSSKRKTLAESLKDSMELIELARKKLKIVEGDNPSPFTEDDYFHFVEELVKVRHQCAHLRSHKGFGIPHGDPKVKEEVLPLIEPLRVIVFEAIKVKLERAS
jgi:hypothetical protein